MIATLETRERLTELVCPTLLLVGEQDTSTPPTAARIIQEQVSGARLKIIAGAAHLVPIEAPQVVNPLLQSFFSEVESEEEQRVH